MDTGYISLHRKILDNPIWKKLRVQQLFITLLLLANHTDKKLIFNGEEMIIKRGQLITGRHKLSEVTGQDSNTIYKQIQLLQKLGMITLKSNNKFSLITIVKYADYQAKTDKSNNKVTTKEQPGNTNNNDNNDNNIQRPEAAGSKDQVNEIIRIFYESVNPTINYGNKSTRLAVMDLINKFGFEELVKICNYAVEVQGRDYAPVITTPYQLKEKYAQLKIYKDKKK